MGCLQYLACATRPDIAFAVGVVSRFVAHPTAVHLSALKHILRYLKGSADLGLKLDGSSVLDFNLRTFVDSDFAGDLDGRKSTYGFVTYLGDAPVSWKSKKQGMVTISTTEAEYVGLSESARTVVWLRRLLSELGFTPPDLPPDDDSDDVSAPTASCISTAGTSPHPPSVMFSDNNGAIEIAHGGGKAVRTRHVDTRFHHVKDLTARRVVQVLKVSTLSQTADVFTKCLPSEPFRRHRESLGLTPLSHS